MSCHDIGRGMNAVVEKVVELMDENKINVEAAREIISKCRTSVHWCDGNEDEAIESIRKCRCGWCLKKIEKGKPLYSLWNVRDYDMFICGGVLQSKDGMTLASDGICEECFDYVVAKKCKEGITSTQVIQDILKHSSIEDNLSEGSENK